MGARRSAAFCWSRFTAEGVNGWGECTAGEHPFYCEESTDTAWYVLREYLAPAFAGKNLESGREAALRMPAVRMHRMAKAALENAVWDAEAQLKQVPLWKLVGGTRKELAAGVSIGIQEVARATAGEDCGRDCGRVSAD